MTDQPTKKTLDAVRAAEKAAQQDVCAIPDGDLPTDLVKALDRRVEVNLEQTGGAEPIVRVGSTDDEVRRLEGPWRLRRRAERADEPAPTNGGSHRRRSTKKTASKKGTT